MSERITVDERGAVTIPANIRRSLGIQPHDVMLLEETAQGLLLRRNDDDPVELYTEERIAEFAREEQALGKVLPSE
jgi:antitoxin PrlF